MQVLNIDVMDGKGLITIVVGDVVQAARLAQFIRDARWAFDSENKINECKSEAATSTVVLEGKENAK